VRIVVSGGDMGQRIEELAALSLGMEGLSYLHSQHKDAGPIKECSCEYAKAFRVVSALRCKDSYEELKAKIRREAYTFHHVTAQ